MSSAVPQCPSVTSARLERLREPAILAAMVLGGTLVLAYTRLHGPVCYFRFLTGLPCPGCGLTRSLEALWHGHLLLSLRYHPLGMPVFSLCAWVLVVALARRLRPETTPLRIPLLSLPAVFAVFAVVWLVRLAFAWSGSAFFLW